MICCCVNMLIPSFTNNGFPFILCLMPCCCVPCHQNNEKIINVTQTILEFVSHYGRSSLSDHEIKNSTGEVGGRERENPMT